MSVTFSHTRSGSIGYGRLLAVLIGAWFAFALSASKLGLFRTASDAPPIPLGLAVLIPVAVFALWYRVSPGFRDFVLSLDLRALTILQAWRGAGIVFVVMYVYGLLPGFFALPAGWGDIAIGVTAPLVAFRFLGAERRKTFITWQLLGMLDLMNAIGLGTAARLLHPEGITTEAMTVLPMSVIPTFLVPLFFIFHIISLAQVRRLSVPPQAAGGDNLRLAGI